MVSLAFTVRGLSSVLVKTSFSVHGLSSVLVSIIGPILTFTASGHLPERPHFLFIFVTFPFAE